MRPESVEIEFASVKVFEFVPKSSEIPLSGKYGIGERFYYGFVVFDDFAEFFF